MNHEFGIRNIWCPRKHPHLKVIDITVEDARYFGMPWKRLSLYEKRKFENVLFLKSHDQRFKTKILYHDRAGRRLAESK